MDISSLLSPQDSPATETPPPVPMGIAGHANHANHAHNANSPAKRTRRQMPSRTPSNMSRASQHSVTSSPVLHQQQHTPHFHAEQLPLHSSSAYLPHQTQQPQHTPHPLHQSSTPTPQAVYTNGRGVHSATATPPYDRSQLVGSPRDARITPPHNLHRQTSTPGMEALAELATMQHLQQSVRQQSAPQRPSITMQNIPRTISGDSNVSMHTEPVPREPRLFSSQFLDAQSLDALNQLEKALVENPFDYYSHVNFIGVLHRGLQNAMHAGSQYKGANYDLLPQLRAAYEAMDQKYTLGERLWKCRIEDERALAKNVEEIMTVLELCKRATAEEPYSAKLWCVYTDYISHLISCTWDPNSQEIWSEDERSIGRELFKTDLLLDTLRQGASFVKFDVSESSIVWDRFLDVLLEDLHRHFTQDKAKYVEAVFTDRLSQPHATWGNTLSKFSTFNSQYNRDNYEATMERVVAQNSRIKEIYAHREEHEFSLLKAIQSGDQAAEYHAITRYLKWEKRTIGVSSFHLVNALYERAHVRFPVDAALWDDHFEFLVWQDNRSVSILDVLQRATRHCPWSGNIWSNRLLTLEAEGVPHHEIEHVKHSATRTGMLEHADIEELIKVQMSWCGYLRRKAFDSPNATEDDPDIAEVGIRSALEHVHEIGTRKYGKDWQGDPKYRLERILIKFFTQHGRVDEARALWDSIVKKHQDSYDFWYRYYIWEMVAAARQGVKSMPADRATAVLERGLKRLNTVDCPEPLIEMYSSHCEQHESALKVRSANIERRRAENIVSIRRAGEKAAIEAAAAQHHAADGSGKRKRGEEEVEVVSAKKTRSAEREDSPAVVATTEPVVRPVSEAPSLPAPQKRDREHSVVIVRNLPKDVTQTKLRKFFTDAGKVRNITTKADDDSVMATIEFEAPEEAQYATMKATKGFEGREITITRGESTTLYVTNYPAHADDAYLRKLFSPFGEILDIRFPSLKYDAHRRFVYVQYASADAAKAASSKLDGSDIEGLKLVAKISDPNAKKKRSGATDEGREVYVRHLTYSLRLADIENAFGKFGTVEHINMPTILGGKNKGNNKGFCFVIFDTKENAQRAVEEMNGKELSGFKIVCEIAKSKNETKPKTKSELINPDAAEPSNPTTTKAKAATPSASADTPMTNTDEATFTAPPSTKQDATLAPVPDRSLALLSIPDTITDARLASLITTPPISLPHFRKITLMPQHGGAIIEFSDVATVGKAGLALDGYEIAPGKKIRVGTVQELKKERAEYRAPTNIPTLAGRMVQTGVKRPVAKPRGGSVSLVGRKKPGLGHHSGASRAAGTGEGEKKPIASNDAFRAMLLGGSGSGSEDKEKEKETGDTSNAQPDGDNMQQDGSKRPENTAVDSKPKAAASPAQAQGAISEKKNANLPEKEHEKGKDVEMKDSSTGGAAPAA